MVTDFSSSPCTAAVNPQNIASR